MKLEEKQVDNLLSKKPGIPDKVLHWLYTTKYTN